MLQGYDRQRPRDLVAVGKKPPTDKGQNRGIPVGIEEVEQAEAEAIEKDQAVAAGKQVTVPLKKEDPEHEFLRKGGQQRVNNHYRSPEQRPAAGKGDEQLWQVVSRQKCQGRAQEQKWNKDKKQMRFQFFQPGEGKPVKIRVTQQQIEADSRAD